MEAIIGWAIALLVIGIGGLIAFRVAAPKVVRNAVLKKMSAVEQEQFDKKEELLCSKEFLELLAPTIDFQKEHNPEKKKRKPVAWLSAFPKAVKTINSRPRKEAKNAVTLVRKQVATAASLFTVTTLPDEDQPANSGVDHFSIAVQMKGLTRSKIASLAPIIQAQLGLFSVTTVDTDDYETVVFECHKTHPDDRLMAVKLDASYLDEHAPKNPKSVTLAITSKGKPWALPMHHTLILGMTGSGKGSPINALIRQMVPFVIEGKVKIYGADPKASELEPYKRSTIFEQVAYDDDDMFAMVEHVHDLMKHRSRTKKVDLENAELGRSLDYTKETPLILFIIDELLSLLITMQSSKEGRHYLTLLTAILAQGRSLGVIVVGATQEADKELLGRMRNNFANAIVLKQPSEYFNDLFLGEGAAANGFDSTKIAPASPANGYATAGIGFVKEETGNPVRVRFIYSSDRDIADLIKANLRWDDDKQRLTVVPEERVTPLDEAPALPALEDEDGGFGFFDDVTDNAVEGVSLPEIRLPNL